MKLYKLRIPSISLLWRQIEATSPADAVKRYADLLNSKTIDYYDESCYEVVEITDNQCQHKTAQETSDGYWLCTWGCGQLLGRVGRVGRQEQP
jgi:hypothetical protein